MTTEYPLFYCERCKTHSVVFKLSGEMQDSQIPRIVPWCNKCDAYPLVNGKWAVGKEYPELEFREKRGQ